MQQTKKLKKNHKLKHRSTRVFKFAKKSKKYRGQDRADSHKKDRHFSSVFLLVGQHQQQQLSLTHTHTQKIVDFR